MNSRVLVTLALLGAPVYLRPAVFTAKLQESTVAAFDRYVQRFEAQNRESRPLLDTRGSELALMDLNPDGGDGGEAAPGGYIHHWIGAIRIPGTTVASVESVLSDYDHWTKIYAPDVKLAAATPTGPDAAVKTYDLRMVTESSQGFLRFAFDSRYHVKFYRAGDFTLVDSRSYQIRESNSGKPPYDDLLPEGNDHGILWRLNSYWRVKQIGTSVYAECQVISLSRKPLVGTRDMVKARARESLANTLRQTAERAAVAGGHEAERRF
jgi:hypothetical protein